MIYEKFEKRLEAIPFDINKRREYHDNVINVINDFKQALFIEYKVTDNPKAEKCWELAWEHGHSSGYSEVENFFDDLVELIK